MNRPRGWIASMTPSRSSSLQYILKPRRAQRATEFVADLEFRSLKDFSPENIQKRIPGQRNDIADLKNAD